MVEGQKEGATSVPPVPRALEAGQGAGWTGAHNHELGTVSPQGAKETGLGVLLPLQRSAMNHRSFGPRLV